MEFRRPPPATKLIFENAPESELFQQIWIRSVSWLEPRYWCPHVCKPGYGSLSTSKLDPDLKQSRELELYLTSSLDQHLNYVRIPV